MDCSTFPKIKFKNSSEIDGGIRLLHLVLTDESRKNIFEDILFIDTGPNRVFYPAVRKARACIEEFEAELYNKRYKTEITPGIVTIQENSLDYCLKIING